MRKFNRRPRLASSLFFSCLGALVFIRPSTAVADDSLRLGILDLPRFQVEEGQVVAFIRSKQLDKAEASLRAMAKRYPKSPTVQYNLACVLSLGGRVDEAFQYLDQSLELGFRKPDHINTDPDLINLRKDERFNALLKSAAEPIAGPTWPQFAKPTPAVGKDGAVTVAESGEEASAIVGVRVVAAAGDDVLDTQVPCSGPEDRDDGDCDESLRQGGELCH